MHRCLLLRSNLRLNRSLLLRSNLRLNRSLLLLRGELLLGQRLRLDELLLNRPDSVYRLWLSVRVLW